MMPWDPAKQPLDACKRYAKWRITNSQEATLRRQPLESPRDVGTREVEDILGRIAYGVYS
jgi:hypothetical protein